MDFGMSPEGMGPSSVEHSVRSQHSVMANAVGSPQAPALYPPVMTPLAPPSSVLGSMHPPQSVPPPSNIPTVVPHTPAPGELNMPVPQLQNIVSTVNLCKS